MNVYVVPDAGGWAVKRGADSPGSLATHGRKDDAIAFALLVAADDGALVIVVDETGKEHRLAARGD